VRSMWSLAGAPDDAALPGIVAPDVHVEFVFHLGETWRSQRLHEGPAEWTSQPSAFVYAQHRGALRFEPTGPVSLLAFRVTPVVANRILGRPVGELWDGATSLHSLIGTEASRLLEGLHACRPEDRFGLLRRWIARRLADWNADDAQAHGLFNEVLWRSRIGLIDEVARALGPSSRSLRRLFATRVGLAPKAVQLSGRVLAACSLLRERADLDITDVATQLGFYDHAAFDHGFADRIGLTPTQFRREPQVFYERE
jgi:AraC-like DNA-binding protein